MSWRQLVRLTRLPTLAATAAPVLVGGALAAGRQFSWPLWLVMVAVAALLQIGANVINEYADFHHGLDSRESAGIAGVLVSGELSAGRVAQLAVLIFLLALGGGLVLVAARGWPLLAMGLLAAAGNGLYSLGPRPLSASVVGEAWVFWLMGPLEVIAVQLAASGQVTVGGLLAGVAVGLLTAAILVANHLRDRTQDLAKGRRTLVGRLGERRGKVLLITLAATGVVLPALWMLLGALPPWSALTLVALPLVSGLSREKSPTRLLPLAARIDLMVGGVLALGILIGR
ncbi:MAG: 1,4-dihydroxy-2-naphthoate octaprenyltransferase [Sulfobacillus sp.]